MHAPRSCAKLAGLVFFATAVCSPFGADAQHFREVATPWGLAFHHHNGATGQRFMVETMVGGVVVFDYDGDGDDDVFFVDGGSLPGYQGEAPGSKLFRNDRGHFVDRTAEAGIDFSGYGCGGAAADIDGDGDIDLYVTAFGRNALYLNLGDGSFREAAAAAGVEEESWSASATFADFDRDGDLDLYVANYVDFDLHNHKFCGNAATGVTGYCHPDKYNGLPDHYFVNDGQGRFAERSVAAGFESAKEAGLGVIAGDLDGDGWPDLYVANDLDPNLLFRNRGDGTFEDISMLSGTALSPYGRPEAGMGVELADTDGDGRLDILVTNFALETNALYHNAGNGLFIDRRFADRIAEPTLPFLGFGLAAIDVDLDGDQDLVFANGHILDNPEELGVDGRYRQRNQLLLNDGVGGFAEVKNAGFDLERASRGLAAADFDLDGDLDLVIVNSNDVAEVYENDSERRGAWSILDLRKTSEANDFVIGARLEIESGKSLMVRERRTASSYLSQGSLAVHWGAAEGATQQVRVLWPRGGVLVLPEVPKNRRLLVIAG